MEATLLLATIAQRFRLRLVSNHPVMATPSFTLRPKYGMQMIVQSRRANRPAQEAQLRSALV
jgi:cytochrome P450